MKIAILILAAGKSSRLGRPKQLVKYQGMYLINHCINICEKAQVGKVFIVLGAQKQEIGAEITSQNCTIIHSPLWKKGMSHSLAFGVSVIAETEAEALIIVLADQPFIHTSLLQKLTKEAEAGTKLALCRYKNSAGPPTMFHSDFFPELQALQGDEGAKPVVKKYIEQAKYISFPQGDIDVDTEEDVHNLEK